MTSVQGQVPANLSAAARLEEQLTATLDEMIEDVEHAESFDSEQRAEIHTILRAVQAETSVHQEALALLSRQMGGGEYVSDA